jgi:hypothetical protein
MRALQAADLMVARIEAERPVLAFFEGASRDVLLYEILHFFLHGISDELRRRIPSEALRASRHFSDLAFLAAGRLGHQHLGEFDVSRHRLERAQQYLLYVGRPKDMTECMVDILLCSRGRASIQQPAEPSAGDADIEIQINLRDILSREAVVGMLDGSRKLAEHYAEEFDLARFVREGSSSL